MAFIGNTVQTQGFTPAIDYFSGNGSAVTFTLSRPVASVAQVIVAIDNVIQNSSTAYSVTSNAITFTSAPLSGTNNIWVQYTSLITTYNAISQDPSVIGDITASGGFLSTGDFGNTYTDGTIVDYVTGNARITTGPADGLTIYNGGTASRTALTTWTAAGTVGIGTTSPNAQLHLNKSSGTSELRVQSGSSFGYMSLDSSGNYIGTGTAIPAIFTTNNAERMRINAGAPILCLAGGNTSATGTGIAFPATQSASTDANTLDDYEEGTWSPVIQNNAGSESITLTGAGTYTKIGRYVFCQINTYNTNMSALGAGSALFIRGLPFNAAYFAANSIFSNYPSVPVNIVDGAGTQAPLYVPVNSIDYSPFSRNSWGGSTQITMRGQFGYIVS